MKTLKCLWNKLKMAKLILPLYDRYCFEPITISDKTFYIGIVYPDNVLAIEANENGSIFRRLFKDKTNTFFKNSIRSTHFLEEFLNLKYDINLICTPIPTELSLDEIKTLRMNIFSVFKKQMI